MPFCDSPPSLRATIVSVVSSLSKVDVRFQSYAVGLFVLMIPLMLFAQNVPSGPPDLPPLPGLESPMPPMPTVSKSRELTALPALPPAPTAAKKHVALRAPKHVKARTLALATSAECDILIGGGTGIHPVDVTLQPGAPMSLIWDFNGCLDGAGNPEPLQSLRFFVTRPRAKNGVQAALPLGTPLTVTVTSMTTGQSWGATYFWANIGSTVGGKFVVTLSLAPSAKKPLAVEVTHVENIGG